MRKKEKKSTPTKPVKKRFTREMSPYHYGGTLVLLSKMFNALKDKHYEEFIFMAHEGTIDPILGKVKDYVDRTGSTQDIMESLDENFLYELFLKINEAHKIVLDLYAARMCNDFKTYDQACEKAKNNQVITDICPGIKKHNPRWKEIDELLEILE